MLAGLKRLGKVPERPVCSNIRHRLPVYDKSRSGLGPPDDFHDAAMNLRACYLQHHFLRFALRDECELESFADLAGFLLSVRGDDVPEIIARIEPGEVDAGSGDSSSALSRFW